MDVTDVQQSVGSLDARGGMPNLFHALGPALLISMGYIDLGKWVAAVEAGSRFGFDLVLLALLFNFTAIVFQYLAACIGTVTGKNLAEICHQEYSQPTCIFLGVQAGLSLLTSELTMIFGIALGFNLLFEYDDLITGICFATVVPNLLPYAISHLGKKMAGTVNACIAGFALLCYVLGLLVSQPQFHLTMNVIFPKLSGESAYSLMALIGANIMAHNFYIHSSVVQGQKRSSAVGLGALFHDHLFSILFIFTGIFLVNYALMNSAAAESTNTLLLTFQDVVELMNQIFVNPMAPTIFLVVLLFSSHIISLTSAIGSQVISQHLFGINLPFSVSGHHLLLKGFAIVPTLYWAKVAGPEGIYQLLIICQIIQAILLPSSVIPLFRVASSRLIMGAHRVSLHLEILAFLAFLLILFSNIIFVAEMLFGDSGWMNNLKGNTGSPVVLPYTVLVLVACGSVVFSLYLAVTPLKSGSYEAESQEWSVHSQREPLNTPQGREEAKVDDAAYEEDQRSDVDPSPRGPDSHPKSAMEYIDTSDTAVESDHDSQQSSAYASTVPETCPSPSFTPEEPKSVVAVNWPEPLEKVSASTVIEESTLESVDSRSTAEREVLVETDVFTDKHKEDPHPLESEKSIVGSTPPSASDDGPQSLTSSRGKGSDAGNGNGSLSRLSGLGRAARRQLATILDEFWGHLFDYHGKLTQEASTKKFDILLGLEVRTPSSAVRTDEQATEIPKSPLVRDTMRGSGFMSSSRDLMSSKNEISNLDMTYGIHMGTSMGSSTWSQGMQLPNTQMQSASNGLLEQSARLNLDFRSPSYSNNNQFYQPATIHGYQPTSYLKQLNASRNPYSSMPLDPQRLPKSSSSAAPTYVDPMMHARNQNLLASLGATPSQIAATSRIGSMMAGRSYYDPSTIDGSESSGSSAYSKKYHSSPDVSALIAASKSALLNEAKLGGAIGPQSYLSRLASERSRYANSIARPEAPLAFDELSPPKLQSDIFSAQSSMSPCARSLWAKQPFGQLFGMSSAELSKGDFNLSGRSGSMDKDDFSYKESEMKLLQSLRFCILRLLKLEGSGWLFKQNGGCDEDLIYRVAAAERLSQQVATENQLLHGNLQQASSDQVDIQYMRTLPNCGEDCIWRASLVVSFGVWCIHRVLDMSLVESRPELWGKYTYVLNRLQGILDPAFSKPRSALTICACLQKGIRVLNSPPHSGLSTTGPVPITIRGTFTTASMVLEMIKDVETAVSSRKGRSGTTAGDVAFPKGKENLASVLKRYQRRLASKGH
ncbi:protein ETHYLENE-INSENSITIVE 2-like [Phragmites australis]|uniref:protein ETHYLENE-INSENSITIVE 2-like n=1 Tax=Phragmites australis TaxID=29695 RepID=UPI002D770EAC|nr:protein ETHYLENE-INSENSITIVE 2-like [Phragmites australis]